MNKQELSEYLASQTTERGLIVIAAFENGVNLRVGGNQSRNIYLGDTLVAQCDNEDLAVYLVNAAMEKRDAAKPS